MRRLWILVICSAILSVCDVCTETTTSSIEFFTTTIAPITTTPFVNTFETTATPTNVSLPALAAKLVRQRRQHPFTIIRHVVRPTKRGTKSRRRYKWPKYKYGSTHSNVGQPISYYKPTKQYLPDISNPPKYSHFEELDLTNHFNSADYEVRPPNGNHYEAQAMDLDFYSHASHAFQELPKVSHIEYSSYDADKEVPTYSYTTTKTKKSKPFHKNAPKQHGGAYEISSSSDFEEAHTFSPPEKVYDMHPMGSYDTPSSANGNKFYEFTSSEANSPSDIHIPATKYGVPDLNIPLLFSPPTKQPDYHAPNPSTVNSYDVYDKKIPNSGYSSSKSSGHHSFAEPPAKTNVEITYSPSYEINLPPSNQKPSLIENYHPTSGNFAEPPVHPPITYSVPKTTAHPPATYQIPQSPDPPSYNQPEPPEPPSYDFYEPHPSPPYETPESQDQPSYDAPESQEPPPYQVPDSPASPSYEEPEPPIHPPSGAFEVPETQPPPFYGAPESPKQPPDADYTSTASHSEYPQPDYITPSEELPINSNYMPPAYNYPKSSYEVPIYDPIPFEASSNEEHETYPPHSFESHNMNGHAQSGSSPVPTVTAPATHTPKQDNGDNVPPSSTIKGRRASSKRKHMRNSTPKHILDTPELEEAFEASQRNKNQFTLNKDADVDESNQVRAQPNSNEGNYFLPTISPDTANDHSYVSTAWNPVRIRGGSTPTVLPAVKGQTSSTPTPTMLRPKGRRPNAVRTSNRQQTMAEYTPASTVTSTRQTTPLNDKGEKRTIVSVDKSRSYSYYGGTPMTPNENGQTLYRTRSNPQRQPTRTPPVTRQKVSARDETAPHRTTKSVFETTYFKSPHNDNYERHLATFVKSLPSNHKLF
ncbi:uncharacterized protein LOC128859999 [Anastrepha ludens]|uniref:uncharacterized protein LOC128859999 n=1 Tax=Anastrepha ludens TaxID=28586 RepID=UPI0023B19116|nr:uncharacterized protein LOC128859999 [Anastrepha ludens]